MTDLVSKERGSGLWLPPLSPANPATPIRLYLGIFTTFPLPVCTSASQVPPSIPADSRIDRLHPGSMDVIRPGELRSFQPFPLANHIPLV